MNSFTFLGMESDYGFHWSMILLFIPLIQRLRYDYVTIVTKHKEVNHASHTLMSAIIMVACSGIVFWTGPAPYFIQPLILSWSIFVLCFDYILNLLRGESWYYMSENSAKSDQIWLHCGVWGTLFVKWWVLLLGFSVYFFLSYAI